MSTTNNKRVRKDQLGPQDNEAGDGVLGPPEIDSSEITREYVLGDGSFGAVYKGRCRQKDVAVKVLFRQFDEKSLRAFRKEVAIMSKIFHPNIVLFLGACTSIPGQLMICTELLSSNLESLLLNPQIKLSLLQRMRMARDAALGVLWLHSSNPVFIHRDLKTSNLLIDSNMTVKVCDFGLSQIKAKGEQLKDGQEGAKGTPLWMAPEVLLGQPFNEKADVYSFGLVLWQILSRQELFPQFDNLDVFIKAICHDKLRPTIPAECPPTLRDLIIACWQENPDWRPDFSQIVAALNNIIVDCAIPDEYGAAFWKQSFKDKDQVLWKDFLNTFARALGLTSEHTPSMFDLLQYAPNNLPLGMELSLQCLKAILVANVQIQGQEEELVTMEYFGKVLAWFGNLKQEGQNILEKIKAVVANTWFHGDISMSESEARLANKMEGTYLVRFSTSEIGTYTISKVSHAGISHQRIPRSKSGKHVVNGRSYETIVELVNTETTNLNLLYACQGSRYTPLFTKQHLSGYLN